MVATAPVEVRDMTLRDVTPVQEVETLTFAVHPRFRRRRIGHRMLQRLFEISEEVGAEWLTLEVRVSNLGAQKLYEKFGFRRAGIRRHYYSDNNEDALIMWTDRLRDASVRERLRAISEELEQEP